MKNMLPPNAASFDAACSHTALGVAYRRTFTGIPHSELIFDILQQIVGPLDPKMKELADAHPLIIPFFEARYLLTDDVLAEIGAQNILEIASGLSPRGYIMSQQPHINYVELDLAENIKLKNKIIDALRRQHVVRPPLNLNLIPGDAKNGEDFDRAMDHLNAVDSEGPVSFICEGLLRYMTWPDKTTLALLIAQRISDNGGFWITPDIEFLSEANATAESRARYDAMAAQGNMDVRPNLFNNMDHAHSFFEDFGFKIQCLPHDKLLNRIKSPAKLGLPLEAVRKDLAKRFTFVMSM